MATCNDQGIPERGDAGAYGWYTRDGKTVMRKRHNVTSKKKPTEGQREIQMGFANEVLIWTLFGDKLEMAFEKQLRKPGETAFNDFVSINERMFHIYLTRPMVQARAMIIPQVIISHGSLNTPVLYHREGQNVVTNIKLGDLVIDRNTTVAEFAAAVIENNPQTLSERHYIGFFKGHQYTDTNTHFPMGEITSGRVKLDGTLEDEDEQVMRNVSEKSLWSVTGEEGFHSVDGFLGTPYTENDLYAWIRVEKTLGNEYRCTNQRMLGGDIEMLERYSTKQAFDTACESYGGFSTKYLAPFENEVNYREYALTDTGSGSTGGSQGGGNQGGGSTGGGSNGGGSGSSGSGSLELGK